MKITLVAVGKVKERHVRQAIDDYLARIKHYASFDERELEDVALAKLGPLVDKHRKQALLVALDMSGASLDSAEFSQRLGRWGSTGKGEVCFVIGGKLGLPPELLKASDFVPSLSAMPLPHRLARLILVEQLYRGLSMLRGEPYGL